MIGFGHGIKVGDLIRYQNRSGKKSTYKVTKLEYKSDPPDMWFASVEWVPTNSCQHCNWFTLDMTVTVCEGCKK